MQIKKINKLTTMQLKAETDLIVADSNVSAMTISHYLDATQFQNDTIPFTLVAVPKAVPYVKNPEFELAIRAKVDLSVRGPTHQDLTDKGNDTGKENYDSSPAITKPLPTGFIELKGE